jgi:hypothetical protein
MLREQSVHQIDQNVQSHHQSFLNLAETLSFI